MSVGDELLLSLVKFKFQQLTSERQNNEVNLCHIYIYMGPRVA